MHILSYSIRFLIALPSIFNKYEKQQQPDIVDNTSIVSIGMGKFIYTNQEVLMYFSATEVGILRVTVTFIFFIANCHTKVK